MLNFIIDEYEIKRRTCNGYESRDCLRLKCIGRINLKDITKCLKTI